MGIFDQSRARTSDAPIQGDVGPEAIDFIFSSMRIDEMWSIRESRGFTWWGHHLAQRVWADPPRIRHDTPRLHAETAVLRGFAPTDGLLPRLGVLNRCASLSALVWHPDSRRLTMHAAITLYQESLDYRQAKTDRSGDGAEHKSPPERSRGGSHHGSS
jgi:hypothetical protein